MMCDHVSLSKKKNKSYYPLLPVPYLTKLNQVNSIHIETT